MKPDERRLARAVLPFGAYNEHADPATSFGDVVARQAQEHGDSAKRLYYVLEKWCGKGWYEYGVSPRVGWLTRAGVAALTAAVE